MADVDEASKMLKWVIPAMAVLLLVVLAFTLERYTHPMPEQDCSKPYDYPICSRAGLPQLYTPPTTTGLFLGLVLLVVLVAIIGYVGYHATVIEQASIITPTATIGKAPVQTPAAASTPAAAAPLVAPAATPAITPATASIVPPASQGTTPSKTVTTQDHKNKPIAKSAAKHMELPVLPPTAKPAQGVSPTLLR